MGVSDGSVVGVTTMVSQGADSSQWNLVIMGDGFTAAQQGDFESSADSFVDILAATPPFSDAGVWSRINVYRVEVHSDETGADDPASCADGTLPFAGLATTAATYFDAAYCATGLRRLLTVDTGLAMTTADDWVPEWDAIVVLVNHAEPGSGSTSVATGSVSGIFDDTIIHELGHSAFNLEDEYESLQGCASGETTQDVYPDALSRPYPLDRSNPNVTIYPTALPGKWGLMIDPSVPVPTTANPDPTTCDPAGEPGGRRRGRDV